MTDTPPTKITQQHAMVEERHPLDPILKPRSVAVIGATEKPGSVGRTILYNLIASPFGGTVYPVSPTRKSVLGVRAYKSIAEVPDKVDCAVIVTPAPTVPGIVQECVDNGVPGAVIISCCSKGCSRFISSINRKRVV